MLVHGTYSNGDVYTDEFNTVIFAIGRDACTANLGLEQVIPSPDPPIP